MAGGPQADQLLEPRALAGVGLQIRSPAVPATAPGRFRTTPPRASSDDEPLPLVNSSLVEAGPVRVRTRGGERAWQFAIFPAQERYRTAWKLHRRRIRLRPMTCLGTADHGHKQISVVPASLARDRALRCLEEVMVEDAATF
jgi:hypothetical protein